MKITSIIHHFAAWFVAAVLLVKVWLANDLHCTLAQDPMELWLALGIAWLLIDGSVRRWEADHKERKKTP